MGDNAVWFVKYKCGDCGHIFTEDCIVDEPECPECGSRDVTSIERYQ